MADTIDKVGNPLKAGDRVAWPTRRGSNVWLLIGTVLKVGLSIHEHHPDRLGMEVETDKGRTLYKDGREVVLVGERK